MVMSSKRRLLIRFLEFFVIGVIFGLVEDLVIIKATTGAPITLEMIGIIFLIALPFAVFTEIIVDHPNFWKKLIPFNDGDEEKQTR